MENNLHGRYKEIDYLRTLAIILMILYHFVYDLNEFAGFNINYEAALWFIIGRSAAYIFIFVAGISTNLSHNPWLKGIRLMAYALLITFATYIFMPADYVRFGILHFLSISTIILIFLHRLKSPILILLSLLIILIGVWIENFYVQTFLLLPLGFKYSSFSSIDYFPLFPYLGLSIWGLLFYRKFYKTKSDHHFSFKVIPLSIDNIISRISNHSLFIYIVHQPILLALVYLLHFISH